MSRSEVGRWKCERCGNEIVAAGPRASASSGIGSYIGGYSGACPWECGAWINRSFRLVRTGQVTVCRAPGSEPEPAADQRLQP